MKKTWLSAVLLLMLLPACGGGGSGSTVASERITFAGSGGLGIFDPSIARKPGDTRMWMSYSAVDKSSFYASTTYWGVSIRLAYSDDNGITWQDGGIDVSSFTENAVGPMAVTSPLPAIVAGSKGVWQSETSSLVYEPGASAGQEWKIIWFQYLNVDLNISGNPTPYNYFLDYSWIAMKTAATPQALAAANTVKLFGGFGIQSDGQNPNSPVFSPIGGPAAIALNSDLTQAAVGASLADLSKCIFAEPGMAATSTAVYLSIFCSDVSTNPPEQYLMQFKCTSPCTMTSAAGWEYLGKLLTPADAAAATGRDHYQAPSIVEQNGKTYLITTPVDTTIGNRYDGCVVYEFEDINTNTLLRNSGGQLIEVTSVTSDPSLHNGACDSINGLSGGIIYSQFDPANAPETFRIYKSQVSIP